MDFETVSARIGFDRNEIRHDLKPIYEAVYKNTILKNKVCEKWGSVENYVDMLYWMRFVRKYNLTQMKDVTGGEAFCRQFQNWGWNYNTFDFEECKRLHREHFENLDEIKDSFNFDDPMFSTEKFEEITKDARGKMTKHALAFYKDKSEEELIRQIYYYLYKCKLSTRDMAYLMNLNVRSVEDMISLFGMKISKSETQKRAAQKRDYSRIEITRRNTVLNASLDDGVFGSHIENTVRTMLATKLENILLYDYEVIVGLNTRTILSPYEIDIPVILINKSSNEITKIAVEVDGERYHRGKRKLKDDDKDEIIKKHGWGVARIPISDELNEPEDIERIVEDTVDSIVKMLGSNDKPDTRKCPICDGNLVIRVASRGSRAGMKFWGCSNYPQCTFIKNITND